MDFEATLTAVPSSRWRTRQAIAFDWYDGPREGVCALAEPACEFYFELLDERYNKDDLDDRLFRLSALPDGTTDRILAAIKALGEPANPVWVPIWRFPNKEAQSKAEELIESERSVRRATAIIIATRDMEDFQDCWKLAPPEAKVADWFAYLDSIRSVAG